MSVAAGRRGEIFQRKSNPMQDVIRERKGGRPKWNEMSKVGSCETKKPLYCSFNAKTRVRIGSGFTWRKRWAWLCSGHGPKPVLLSLNFIRSRNLGHYRPKCGPKQDRNFNSLFGRENSLFFAESFLFTPKNFPACSTGRSNFVTAWLYQSSQAIGISHIRHDQTIGPDDTRQRIDGLNAVHVYLSKHSPRSETSLRTCGRRLLARRVRAEC